ncbi:hypothetical protein JYB64_07700 [Algoriphagus aestuarii]|nr:hypothetical protein [Algoriphagus aestuarii]
MKRTYLYFLFTTLFLISCSEEEKELDPGVAVLGKYVLEIKGSSFDLINSIDLKPGGNVVGAGIIQKSQESDDLGYNYYFTGTYTIKEDVISIFQESYFQVTEAGKLFEKRDQMTLVQTRSASSDYLIQSNFTELHYICPPNSICMDEMIFVKER